MKNKQIQVIIDALDYHAIGIKNSMISEVEKKELLKEINKVKKIYGYHNSL